MYDLLKVTMLGLFFGTFGTTLGGIIGVRFQNPSNKILSFILSLAGGLMTSILSFDLIPEALKIASITNVILGIALDNPAMTDKNKLRYDVGLIVNGNPDIALDIRKIPDGIYAVFELPHTEQDITAFWSNIQKLVGSLSVDETKPVIERYPADKVAKHLCEFCIPLK